ncbi:MAG: homoserine dehydrogenase [Clostridia bacterium]|nr:homoserine dehydrogenase [Clostridia bacterium]
MVIGLMGFGTIGAGVYELAKNQKDLEIRYVLDIREIGIPEMTHRAEDLFEDPEVDTVIEVMGGLHPAYEFVTAALKAGKNVVTANKYLVATYYDELTALAKEMGVAFRCTAAVGGGIGWLTALERVRRLEPVVAVEGIMNGTTNYILTNMAQNGLSFETALSEAQALGYAEADPSADIDGLDVMHKLLLSANIAFDLSLDPKEIAVFGIRNITDDDVWNFKSRHLTCKLLGRAFRKDGQVAVFVQPTLLPEASLTASVPTNFNLITYDTEFTGKMSYYGQGAGRYPTAANVVQDCLDLLAGVADFYADATEKATINNRIARYPYYVKTTADTAALTAESWGDGVLTKEMTVAEMAAFVAAAKETDPKIFVAALKTEE